MSILKWWQIDNRAALTPLQPSKSGRTENETIPGQSGENPHIENVNRNSNEIIVPIYMSLYFNPQTADLRNQNKNTFSAQSTCGVLYKQKQAECNWMNHLKNRQQQIENIDN